MSLREPKPVTVKPSPPDKSAELQHTHGEKHVWQHHDSTWKTQVAKSTRRRREEADGDRASAEVA